MQCNYGLLKKDEVYTIQDGGEDWFLVCGIFVYSHFVEVVDDEPLWDYDKERWDNLPVCQEDQYESYAQYINRELPPVACW